MARRPAGRAWQNLRHAILTHSNRCWICGQPGADEVDHVTPLALGGAPWDVANLRPAHRACNLRKGSTFVGDEPSSREWL